MTNIFILIYINNTQDLLPKKIELIYYYIRNILKLKGSLIFPCLVTFSACGGSDNTLKVKNTDYEEWPLKVTESTLSCEPDSRVTFTTLNDEKYAVNGSTSSEYQNILKISKDVILDEKNTIKMSSSELIKTGLNLCSK